MCSRNRFGAGNKPWPFRILQPKFFPYFGGCIGWHSVPFRYLAKLTIVAFYQDAQHGYFKRVKYHGGA